MTWTSPSAWSIATYFRARSSTAGSDLGNRPSMVKVPHECHRFLVSSRAPHRGQMLMPGGPSSASTYPMSALPPCAPQTSLVPRQVSLSSSLCVRLGKVTRPQGVRRVVSTVSPTAQGPFEIHGYPVEPGREHLALVLGDLDHAGSNG